MPIDPTKPADGVAAVKGDLRANLQAAKDGILPTMATSSATAITVDAATFGDAQLVILLCTASGAVTVTGANDVPEGKMLMYARKGTGNVSFTANTFTKPTSVSASTTELHEAITVMVEDNPDGQSAQWWLPGRPA